MEAGHHHQHRDENNNVVDHAPENRRNWNQHHRHFPNQPFPRNHPSSRLFMECKNFTCHRKICIPFYIIKLVLQEDAKVGEIELKDMEEFPLLPSSVEASQACDDNVEEENEDEAGKDVEESTEEAKKKPEAVEVKESKTDGEARQKAKEGAAQGEFEAPLVPDAPKAEPKRRPGFRRAAKTTNEFLENPKVKEAKVDQEVIRAPEDVRPSRIPRQHRRSRTSKSSY
ncbi:hypothetical protein L596_017407 [Steinernema carpocapsae]|uniref:Uncharacterized protein n=1 Tax=Steinernema carpocapsae TaxID=34508 RepID=A0A4U5N2C3_STECR|nr:hypothetical protein L596_017407 [Steinernema carpocapsae]